MNNLVRAFCGSPPILAVESSWIFSDSIRFPSDYAIPLHHFSNWSPISCHAGEAVSPLIIEIAIITAFICNLLQVSCLVFKWLVSSWSFVWPLRGEGWNHGMIESGRTGLIEAQMAFIGPTAWWLRLNLHVYDCLHCYKNPCRHSEDNRLDLEPVLLVLSCPHPA